MKMMSAPATGPCTLFFAVSLFLSPAWGWIEICKAPAHQSLPSVAFNDGQYLIAWADLRDWGTDSSVNVYAARVSQDGTLLDDGGFLVAGGWYDQTKPRVCPGPYGWLATYQERC
jgi:hypothetical protein